VALLVVMLMVFAMAVIVGAFAYTMRVEGRLAIRTQSESDLEWMGRSGVEMAKWVLSLSRQIPGEQTYDGLNQFWAGGPGPTNVVENVFEGVLGSELVQQHTELGVDVERLEVDLGGLLASKSLADLLRDGLVGLLGSGLVRDLVDLLDGGLHGGGLGGRFLRLCGGLGLRLHFLPPGCVPSARLCADRGS
jgi:hypothetical protein